MRAPTTLPTDEIESRSTSGRFPSRNNFDLVRLLAAAQVALIHGVEHLGLRLPAHETCLKLLQAFPGVPVFFCISGFLISASFQRSGSLRDFLANRVLRIFPALWICFGLSVVLIASSGYFSRNGFPIADFFIWAAAQLSFVQFYNPDFLRGYGVGAANGSLWTIPVEMQFYLLTPILIATFHNRKRLFLFMFASFLIINFLYTQILVDNTDLRLLRKFAAITFLPWIYMFMMGAACQFYWPRIRGWLEGRFSLWLAACAAAATLSLFVDVGIGSNTVAFPWAVLLLGLTLSAAFTRPGLAETLLARNDISYGVYIYHMPIYNFGLEIGVPVGTAWMWALLAIVAVVACLSWRWVEKPALALKRQTILTRRQAVTPTAMS